MIGLSIQTLDEMDSEHFTLLLGQERAEVPLQSLGIRYSIQYFKA